MRRRSSVLAGRLSAALRRGGADIAPDGMEVIGVRTLREALDAALAS